MSAYALALFGHLLSLLLAVAATSLSTFAALRLRAASDAHQASQWTAAIARVVPAFPVAVVGLLATGAYMTQTLGRWSAPWILASLAGLALIVLLGAGVEGGRGRALARELRGSGSDLSAKAQRLLRDPLAWSARLMTLALMIAVVFDMTTKPASVGAAASLPAALAVGALCAVPLWRSEPRRPEPVSLLSRADR